MNILNLYKNIDQKQRFVDEVFSDQIYNPVRPQLTIIDGGAYEGEFSFYCLPFAKIIYAFEPDPRPFKRLDKYVKKFGLQDIIKHSSKALASTNGFRYFHNSGGGGSSMFEGLDSQPKDSIRVKTITLSKLIEDEKLEIIDILKMDMENAENESINSPEFPNIASKIKMIIGEHLGPSVNTLERLGYKMSTHLGNYIFVR